MYTFSQKCFKIINIMSGIPLALDHFGNPKTLLYTLLKATLNLLKVKYFTIPIGYEPADLTVHPPPKQSRVGSFFSHRCLVPPKFFPQRKSGFCRRCSH